MKIVISIAEVSEIVAEKHYTNPANVQIVDAGGMPVGANFANVLSALRDTVYHARSNNLISAIKTLRGQVFPGMGLKESKDIVEFLRDNR